MAVKQAKRRSVAALQEQEERAMEVARQRSLEDQAHEPTEDEVLVVELAPLRPTEEEEGPACAPNELQEALDSKVRELLNRPPARSQLPARTGGAVGALYLAPATRNSATWSKRALVAQLMLA